MGLNRARKQLQFEPKADEFDSLYPINFISDALSMMPLDLRLVKNPYLVYTTHKPASSIDAIQ